MGSPQTGWFRTESGTVLEMDLPLSEPIAQRVKAKEIVRVMRASKGDQERWVPFEEPEPAVEVDEDVDPPVARAEHEAALARIAELEADLAAVTAERDELKATADAKPATAKPAKGKPTE